MQVRDLCLKLVWEKPARASDDPVLFRAVNHADFEVPFFGAVQVESLPLDDGRGDEDAPYTEYVVMPEADPRDIADAAAMARMWDEIRAAGAQVTEGLLEVWVLVDGVISGYGAYSKGAIGASMQDGVKLSDTVEFVLTADSIRIIDPPGVTALEKAAATEGGMA